MRIFDFCCQTKSKKTIDYISSWIDATEIELKQMHTDISKLSTSMSSIVTGELGPIFDAYAQTYDYSSVIPELSTLQTEIEALGNALENKIDKPLTSTSGNLVAFGSDNSIKDSGKSVSALERAIKVNNSYGKAEVSVDVDADPEGNGGEIDITLKKGNNPDKYAIIDTDNIEYVKQVLNGDIAHENQIKKTTNDGHAAVTIDVDGDPIDGGGEIWFSVKRGNGSDLPKNASINPDNIENFSRALNEPSKVAPEGDSTGANKLITSKAVYDALALKVDKLSYSDTSAFFADSAVIDTIYETGVYILTYTPTTDNPATPHILQVRHYLDQPAPDSAYVNMVEQCLIDKDGIRIRTCECDVDGVPTGTWSSWS